MYRLTSAAYATALAACPANTNPQANIIITGLRRYGIIMADNGNVGLVGTPDSRWNDTDLSCITTNIKLSAFEPVNMGRVPVQYGTGAEPNYTSYQANQPLLVSISVAPSSATIPTVTGTQQFTPACTYSDSSVDDCTQAGGVTWAPLSGSLIANSNSSGW